MSGIGWVILVGEVNNACGLRSVLLLFIAWFSVFLRNYMHIPSIKHCGLSSQCQCKHQCQCHSFASVYLAQNSKCIAVSGDTIISIWFVLLLKSTLNVTRSCSLSLLYSRSTNSTPCVTRYIRAEHRKNVLYIYSIV